MEKRWIPVVSLVICFLMAFTMTSSSAFAGNKVQDQSNKVSEKLIQQFANNEFVTYLVKLKSQVDTEKVARASKEQIRGQELTAKEQQLFQRKAVVDSLQNAATETQRSLVAYLAAQKKAGKVREYHSYFIVNALAVTSTQEVFDTFAILPEVAKILPNETRKIIGLNPQSVRSSQSNVQPQAIGWNIDQIGAPKVWSMGINGTGTVVGSIDTGVQWNHPALKEKYRGFDAANPNQPSHTYSWFDATNPSKTAPYDDLRHGTHTMGTMLGSESNGENQIGVAPGAKWIAVKAFTSTGGTDTNLLSAGEWMIAPKDANGTPHPEKAPDVINNSWGGGSGLNEWYRPMVKNWKAANIFPEFSAGNSASSNPAKPGSVAEPANYPESFATGATDSAKKLAYFSLLGPSPYNEMKPEVVAPGVDIRSCVPGGTYQGGWNGTSMAGPHVSGTVALLKQADPALTVDEMEDILEITAAPLTDSTYPNSPNNGYGYGLVNAYGAVSAAIKEQGEVTGKVTLTGSQGTVDATVSVVETGQFGKTNADGSYAIKILPGTYILRAQAAGYLLQEITTQVPSGGGTVTQNFTLQPTPQGTVYGKVTDQKTGNPIVEASVALKGETYLTTKTDANGDFAITAGVGSYTLYVTAAKYYEQGIPLTLTENRSIEQNIALKPFTEQPAILAYDTGKPWAAHVFGSAGDGWGVRMSPDPGISDTVQLTGGSFLFWGAGWPNPGGTDFQVAIYGASADGKPGAKLAGPFNAKALRNGTWTGVDLSSHNIVVKGDFYLVYLQSRGFPYVPGLYSDGSKSTGRSWQFVGGRWYQSPSRDGNYMIRANVTYKLGK